eukprot:SAG31_NODE_2_length_46263_cov_45.908043_25_plen_135_part_00
MDTLLLPSTLLSSLLLVLLFHAARPTLSDVETARDSRDFAEELKALYSRVNPSKLGDVPYLLLKNKGKEAQLIAAVEQKYSGRPCTLDEINSEAQLFADHCCWPHAYFLFVCFFVSDISHLGTGKDLYQPHCSA